jgi:hypothetical protein
MLRFINGTMGKLPYLWDVNVLDFIAPALQTGGSPYYLM